MKTYNKLVRDNIPNIIKEAGKNCITRELNDNEYIIELKNKLVEEAKELTEAQTLEETIEELADIYEVIEAILMQERLDLFDIQKARIYKNKDKGAFENKVYLESVSD